jgi:hypothetical protein
MVNMLTLQLPQCPAIRSHGLFKWVSIGIASGPNTTANTTIVKTALQRGCIYFTLHPNHSQLSHRYIIALNFAPRNMTAFAYHFHNGTPTRIFGDP